MFRAKEPIQEASALLFLKSLFCIIHSFAQAGAERTASGRFCAAPVRSILDTADMDETEKYRRNSAATCFGIYRAVLKILLPAYLPDGI